MEENNNFLYNGYLLVIDVSGDYLSARCKELKYDNVAFQMSTLKNDFMKFVDEKLEKEKEMIEQELYKHGEYLLTIKPAANELFSFIGIATYKDTIFRKFCGDTAKEVKEKFNDYMKKNQVYNVISKVTLDYRGVILTVESHNTEVPGNPDIYYGQCEVFSIRTFGNSDKSKVIDLLKDFVDEELDKRNIRIQELEKENLFLKNKLDTIRIEIFKKAE